MSVDERLLHIYIFLSPISSISLKELPKTVCNILELSLIELPCLTLVFGIFLSTCIAYCLGRLFNLRKVPVSSWRCLSF